MIDYSTLVNKIVLVYWIDSMTSHGWISHDSKEHLEPIPTISSVGFFLDHAKDHIVIAGDNSNDAFNRPIRIPKGCIISTEALTTQSAT